ncbi:MAG TPA: VWA domain-containing protein [Thermoplasmata archaeon]|nr:VWA domain-containing protein [Thermoplasmata archaeon]
MMPMPQKPQLIDKEEILSLLHSLTGKRYTYLTKGRFKSGRRVELTTRGAVGHYIKYRESKDVKDFAFAPTIRAAAKRAGTKRKPDGLLEIKPEDFREKIRKRKASTLTTFIFDTSGSLNKDTIRQGILEIIKILLLNSYQKRDRIALVSCQGRESIVVHPFTSSLERAMKYLKTVHFRGMTPLASGIQAGLNLLKNKMTAEPEAKQVMIIVTDGKANEPIVPGGDLKRELLRACYMLRESGVKTMVIDVGEKPSPAAKFLAEQAGSIYYYAMKNLPRRRRFVPILGEEKVKKALIYCTINPFIGGILIKGSKDVVTYENIKRFAGVLPEIEVNEQCPYNCDPERRDLWCWQCNEKKKKMKKEMSIRKVSIPVPVVSVPLDVNIDELFGANVPKAKPGLIGKANRGILYIEDINLIEPEIRDIILDMLGKETYTYEGRDGYNITVPCNFILVGTWEPDEWSHIDRKIIDKLGIQIEMRKATAAIHADDTKIGESMEIVAQRRAYESNPQKYHEQLEIRREEVIERIEQAQELIKKIRIPYNAMDLISRTCESFRVEGHETEIMIERIARTIADFEGREVPIIHDVIEAAQMTLPNRQKKAPVLEEKVSKIEEIKELVKRYAIQE